MTKRFILITAAFLMLVTHASAGANINITAIVVAPIGSYNSPVNISANHTIFINAPETSTAIMLASSKNVSGSVNILLTSTPIDIPSLSVPSINKYLRIDASPSLTNNLTYALIRFHYTDEEISATGMEEGSLGFYWWNKTTSAWEKLTPAMDWVYGTGVDTVENYVWVNVTHFSDYSIGGLRMPPSLKITQDQPSQIKTNKKFDVALNLRNIVNFKIFNITIKEKIPEGYKIQNEKKIFPRPVYVGEENGSTVIYWLIDKVAAHTNLSLKYSLAATKSPRYYTFNANAFGFDSLNNKYAAFNVSNQEVKKTPSIGKHIRIFWVFYLTLAHGSQESPIGAI